MINNQSTFKSVIAETLRESASSFTVEKLVSTFQTPHQLLGVTEIELTAIKGIGKAKAKQILAAIQFAKMLLTPPVDKTVIRSPGDVFDLLRMEIAYEMREHFVVLFLDTKNNLMNKETLSIGSLNASVVHPREVFRAAVRNCCASIICAHQHPSGDPAPSSEDVEVTQRLVETGRVIGIPVLDHIILGTHKYVSLKEQGLI